MHLLYNKDIERKLRKEIDEQIGDRIPTHEDRNRCHYVMAFIKETLRHRNAVPIGLQHKTIVTTKLGDYTIPAGTEIMIFQAFILHQKKHWENPFEFIPERFIDSDGQCLSSGNKAFIPFGVGRRVCLGDKLAIAVLFLVLVRFLQKTTDFEIVLHCNEKDILDSDPKLGFLYHPKYYQISFNKKI